MSAAEAQTFGRFSIANAAILAEAAATRGCACEPYSDWFTYDRWQAQGLQVCKAAEVGHGVRLANVHTETRTNGAGEEEIVKRFGSAVVFCRCQVKPKAAAPAA